MGPLEGTRRMLRPAGAPPPLFGGGRRQTVQQACRPLEPSLGFGPVVCRPCTTTCACSQAAAGSGVCAHGRTAPPLCRALLESFRRADLRAQASFKDHKLDEQTERTLFESVGLGLKKGTLKVSTAVTGGAEKIGDFFMCATALAGCWVQLVLLSSVVCSACLSGSVGYSCSVVQLLAQQTAERSCHLPPQPTGELWQQKGSAAARPAAGCGAAQ